MENVQKKYYIISDTEIEKRNNILNDLALYNLQQEWACAVVFRRRPKLLQGYGQPRAPGHCVIGQSHEQFDHPRWVHHQIQAGQRIRNYYAGFFFDSLKFLLFLIIFR